MLFFIKEKAANAALQSYAILFRPHLTNFLVNSCHTINYKPINYNKNAYGMPNATNTLSVVCKILMCIILIINAEISFLTRMTRKTKPNSHVACLVSRVSNRVSQI